MLLDTVGEKWSVCYVYTKKLNLRWHKKILKSIVYFHARYKNPALCQYMNVSLSWAIYLEQWLGRSYAIRTIEIHTNISKTAGCFKVRSDDDSLFPLTWKIPSWYWTNSALLATTQVESKCLLKYPNQSWFVKFKEEFNCFCNCH